MEIKNSRDNQVLLKMGLEANIKSNNIEKLKTFLTLAESVSIPKSLHYRAIIRVADALNQSKSWDESFKFFNEARKFTNKPTIPLKKAYQSLHQFFELHETVFSKSDLRELLLVIEPFMALLKIYLDKDKRIEENLALLTERVNYRLTHTASDVEETKITFRIAKLKAALYADMTLEEMRSELARLVALMVLTKKVKSDKKETKKERAFPSHKYSRKKNNKK